jgi:hypothetical protein
MEEHPPSDDSERLEALRELFAISAISESDYKRESSSTPAEPPTSQAADRRRLVFLRRFRRRER